jgi:2,3-bisphosphoglycerate-independent phosphoglycerate mutase
VEAVDECSHLGDLKLKLQAIEDFDSKVVLPLLKALEGRKEISFAVLPDHPVPVKLRLHTTTPVPLAICGPAVPEPDELTVYSETAAPKGALGALNRDMLVRKLLGL